MERPKNKFIAELEKGLGNHQDKKSILMEYEVHIDEILIESMDCMNEYELMERIKSRLGTPEEIAAIWKEELSVTPSNMKWLFIIMNIFFFGGGSLLTFFHNVFHWNWLTVIWSHLTAIPSLIAFIYMFFWALLGYEIGKGFGHGGTETFK